MNKLDGIKELMNIDIEFCEECKIHGANGWVKFFADDGVMATSSERDDIIGKENIHRAISKVFDLEDISFTWEPVYCDVSDDLSFGHTSGTSIIKFIKNGEEIIQHGKYSSVWKKIDGKWKVILDLGN